jgi:hypothetical protein
VRWVEHVAHVWESREMHGGLVEKLEGKKQLGRNRSRWDDNVKMDLEKEVWVEFTWLSIESSGGLL